MVISANGIDMGNKPISNASQIDSIIINENNENVATISNLIGFKNLLINANFLVNQRGYVSGTNTTVANQYCHDRWRVPVSGQNVTFTKTANVVTVTAPAGGYEQVIEDINVYSGDYKISHEGTATVSVAESTDNVTYTTLSPNANGTYTLTGGKYVRVRFSSGTIIKPQVELGNVRTPFENRPYGLELSLCQRYQQDAYGGGASYASSGVGIQRIGVSFGVPMRAVPTCVVSQIGGNGSSPGVLASYLNGVLVGWVSPSASYDISIKVTASAEL